MSTSYYTVAGIGIDTAKIFGHINNHKVIDILLKLFPDDLDLMELKKRRNLRYFPVEEYLYEADLYNFAELIARYCDDTNTLTHGDADDGEFLYYPPSMPWERRENEPKSVQEVHDRIISAVMKVTDMSREEIEALIEDDLFAVGCG